jgi:anti-sigma regulatory factor (Ser/Thr protein kinase)
MTMAGAPVGESEPLDPFVHEGLFYRGRHEYVESMTAFVRDGLEAGEPVMVAVPGENLELIRSGLGADSDRVTMHDMSLAGRNPGRIIPTVLLAFIAEHAGSQVRIIGEPIWAGRSEVEYPACVQHEALINLALAGQPATVLCPYDASQLHPRVICDAEGTHPVLVHRNHRSVCQGYVDPVEMADAFNQPLPEPTAPYSSYPFRTGDLPALREIAGHHAIAAGLTPERVLEFQLSVHELAANTVEHGGGGGTARVWREPAHLVWETWDSGHITDPLAGRRPQGPNPERGRGLLLIHSLCDLVRVHTRPGATTVRMYVRT